MDKDTLIVTDHRKQNKGRGLIIGDALAILAGMYIIDKSSTCYTVTDSEDRAAFRKLQQALEYGVDD